MLDAHAGPHTDRAVQGADDHGVGAKRRLAYVVAAALDPILADHQLQPAVIGVQWPSQPSTPRSSP